ILPPTISTAVPYTTLFRSKEFEPAKNRWRAAVRVPVLIEEPETGDDKAWGIITVDSLEPNWPQDPTYSEVLEFAAMLLSMAALRSEEHTSELPVTFRSRMP